MTVNDSLSSISLNDVCNNGYDNITINGSILNTKGRKTEESIRFEGRRFYYDTNSGTELILEHFPQVAPIILVNGCDMFGFYSYPLCNISYHCTHSKEFAKKTYRLTDEEVVLFGQLNYTALAVKMNKLAETRYKNEIDAAIVVIEKLTGQKYTCKEFVSHQLFNDIEYCILSKKPEKERKWNLVKGIYPKKYQIDLKM